MKRMACKLGALLLMGSMVVLSLLSCDHLVKDLVDDYLEVTTNLSSNENGEVDGDYPELTNALELRDFLYESIEDGEYSPKFRYTGDKGDITARNIARILSAYFITIRGLSCHEECWQVEYTPYPGDRIVTAYQNEDTSRLSEDELDALEVAIEVVEEAKSETSNALELELYLHDWLCDQITYDNGTTAIQNGQEILPHLTALGALLEGKANCQGYTDGFYVLASIAGFDVGKQSCVTVDGVGHTFNTIRLDGKWYVVDVTFNDDTFQDGENIYQDYRLFNAGTNECTEYSWPEEYQHCRLQTESSEWYYYLLSEENSLAHGYEKCFEDVDDITDAIVKMRRAEDRDEIYMMLKDGQASWKDLNLETAFKQYGLKTPEAIWYLYTGKHTYFYIRFE